MMCVAAFFVLFYMPAPMMSAAVENNKTITQENKTACIYKIKSKRLMNDAYPKSAFAPSIIQNA